MTKLKYEKPNLLDLSEQRFAAGGRCRTGSHATGNCVDGFDPDSGAVISTKNCKSGDTAQLGKVCQHGSLNQGTRRCKDGGFNQNKCVSGGATG